MNILMCHNYYQQPGGEDQIFHDEAALLKGQGHEVLTFDMHNNTINERGKLAVARDTIWNRKVYSQIQKLVRANSVRVVHFHNTFPLISPAAYYAARRGGAAVVQTLHNYRLMCPGATLCRAGRSCTKCVGKIFPSPAVQHRCYRGSRSASLVLASMLGIHRVWGTWHRAVDRYVVATEGARQRFREGGLPVDRIMIKPNFVHPDPGPGTGDGGFALFVGRLASEKGIDTLLQAWSLIPGQRRLLVAGDGPLRESVRAATESDSRVEWLGWKKPPEVLDVIGRATCLIMPSLWIEGLPKTLLEAFAKGTPAVASRLGAMAEVIEHGRTGLLFQAGDAQDLADKVMQLMTAPPRLQTLRTAAREEYAKKYTATVNYRNLKDIYQSAIAQYTHTIEQSGRGSDIHQQRDETTAVVS